MVYGKKHFRDKINELRDQNYYEEACFVIIEGLSCLTEMNKDYDDFEDDELIELMEIE